MAQVIVYQNDVGGVSVCAPTGEIDIQMVLQRDIPKNTNAYIIDNDALPWDSNDFFNAWELNGNTVVVSLSKAKELTKERLRLEREPLLREQDVAFQRAIEEGRDTTAIVAEKQRLRDLTKLADEATNIDELRAINVYKA